MKHGYIYAVLACIAMLSACAAEASAQKVDRTGDFEIRLGAGLPYFLPVANVDYTGGSPVFPGSTYGADKFAVPPVNVGVGYGFARWLVVEGGLHVASSMQNRYDCFTDELVHRNTDTSVSLSFGVRFVYVSRKYFSMYSSFGAAVSFEYDDRCNAYGEISRSWDIYPMPVVKLLGFTFGDSLFGFLDFGYGPMGLCSAGIGYRF